VSLGEAELYGSGSRALKRPVGRRCDIYSPKLFNGGILYA